MPGTPKVAILGAGSVGCFIGGSWATSGVDVRLIGRARLAGDIARHGLTLSDYTGWETKILPDGVDYRCDPEALSGAQIIALAVKSGDTQSTAELIARHGTPGALVISFQNGISNVEVLEKVLAPSFDVVRGLVTYNVAYLGNGHFHKGVAGELFAERRPATRGLAELIGSGPAALKLSDDMLALAWGKLLINLNNAVNALSGMTLREQLKNRACRKLFAASIREGLDILDRAGIIPATVGPISPRMMPRIIDTPNWLFNAFVMRRWKIDARARSSMADDLAAGRKTEIDYLNGELVRLADAVGRNAPVNRAIVDLVHKAEAGAEPLSVAALFKASRGG